MKVVARRTGLSPHLIRMWERRYGAVKPERSETKRRLYSEAEIARLQLLHEATQAGHHIGQIARLSHSELSELLKAERQVNRQPSAPPAPGKSIKPDYVAEGLAAIKRLDGQGLENVLSRGASELGQLGLLQQVMVPLIQQIGDCWQGGTLKVAHEHIATAVIRTFLGSFARAYTLPESSPRLLVTTPPGQLHELGAVMVAVTASNLGWRVTYLGPCLPAEEIAGAALQNRARAVALSLVYPEDDPYLEAELKRLRQLLPGEAIILIGGRAAAAYQKTLDDIGAIYLHDLAALQTRLDAMRKGTSQPSVQAETS